MKKHLKLVGIGLLATALLMGGCAKPQQTQPEANNQEAATTLGGWSVYPENKAIVTDNDQALFDKALEGWTGVGYTPLRVLATQVVSGTNYAFLAKGVTVTAKPETGYYIVTIYEDLQGKAEVKCIKQIDFTDPKVTDATPETLAGGWQIFDNPKDGMLPEEKAQVSFEKAAQKQLGVKLVPISLLGTQLVNGTNYCAICRGSAVTQNPIEGLYIAKWYENTQGESEMLDVVKLDLNYYVDPSQE